uniref:Helicase POLQ-like n=1 Tax=Glossina brevipalpis TaxID=37001 RepID=A0A1A9WCV6_9MUSC
MSKKKYSWEPDIKNNSYMKSKKRKSLAKTSEHVLWSEADNTLFTDVKLNNLLENDQPNNKPMNNENANDSLFNSMLIPACDNTSTNETATPLPQVLRSDIDGNDTLFTEINLNELLEQNDDNRQMEPMESSVEDVLQNTQRFLNDVAFKVPKPITDLRKVAKEENTFIAKSNVNTFVQGTQYETREEIQNRTMTVEANKIHSSINQQLEGLSGLNWETQIFAEVADVVPSKGNFYGLPEKVKQMIFEHKGIKNLYEWQDECLHLSAVRQRKNLIYALPTSGGKTLVAEILILREVICREKNVLFILPYVSIVQEKVSSMSPFAINLDFLVEEYTAGRGKCPPIARRKRKSIYIASIEKGSILFDSLIEVKRANEIGLVVIDELHLVGERGRGATLEILLTKIMYLNANIQVVGMSATIGNLSELSKFLNADVYTRGFRPVELKEYIKCGRDILEINLSGKSVEEIFIYKRTVNFNYSDAVLRSDPDHLAGLVTECCPKNNCLIFCSSRKNCENVAVLLSRILPKSKFLDYHKRDKDDLMDALNKVCGILSPVLARTIPYGVAYHHSGLTIEERKFIETAYRLGTLCVICCTSTLAAGVNLPAKRVIIRAPYVGAEFMTLCKYKQMIGRAGRAGLGEAGESILICSSRDNVRVGEMLFSPMDKASSSLDYQGQIGIQSLVLSAIGLGLASSPGDLYRLFGLTLLAVQSAQSHISVDSMVRDILKNMFKNKILKMSAGQFNKEGSHIVTSQDIQNKVVVSQLNEKKLIISKKSRFELTTIGKAAFKANIDYNKAYAIYHELKIAQKHLVLTNYIHILYLVIAFNSNANADDLFPADASIFFQIYEQLDDVTQMIFTLTGFTEAHAAKMGKTMSIQGPLEKQSNRLYKVLILNDIINLMPLPTIAAKYNIERGLLQSLTNQATAGANALVRLCDEMEEFWCFNALFERIAKKMDKCSTAELEPLLELPSVKVNRAKQLYTAGYKTIEDVAKVRPIDLVKGIEHMPMKIAKEIVSAAKIIIMKKLDHLEEETEALKVCLKPDNLNDT